MQNLKVLTAMVSEKRPTLKFSFFKRVYMLIISLEHVHTKKWYIHDLLYVFNNHTLFKLNRIRTLKFQFKSFDTAVTLKYNQGHWKWYEWIKLSKYYHHAKFDSYYVYSVRENRNVKVFATYGHLVGWPVLAGRPYADHYTLTFSMWIKKHNF